MVSPLAEPAFSTSTSSASSPFDNSSATMMPAPIRDRMRTLRYRHLLVRQVVQMKDRISGLLMERGVE